MIHRQTIERLKSRIDSIQGEIRALQTDIDAEPLAASDRQYLGRCFDLLHMELEALESCISTLD